MTNNSFAMMQKCCFQHGTMIQIITCSNLINSSKHFVLRQHKQIESKYYVSSFRNYVSKLPPPTWSLHELTLLENRENEESVLRRGETKLPSSESITEEELNLLSRRCLIDITSLCDHERNKLKIELQNIMRCVTLVTSFESPTKNTIPSYNDDNELKEEMMYDIPRGFSSTTRSCPVRLDDVDVHLCDDENKAEADACPNEGAMEGSTHILEKLKQTGKLVQSSTVSLQTKFKKEDDKRTGVQETDDAWYFSVITSEIEEPKM